MYREYVALEPGPFWCLAGFVGRHGSLEGLAGLVPDAAGRADDDGRRGRARALTACACTRRTPPRRTSAASKGGLPKRSHESPRISFCNWNTPSCWICKAATPNWKRSTSACSRMPTSPGMQRALVLNNLAYLLAVQNKTGESRKLIERSRADSRSSIRFARHPGARDIWRTAIPGKPSRI